MFVLGGLCFISIGAVKEYFFESGKNILSQLAISCLVITALELLFGLVFNVWLGLDIWDYSKHKFNFMGQICLTV